MFIGKMIETVAGSLDGKRRYRQYKSRTAKLPANYRAALEALERYLMCFGPGTGESLLHMLEELGNLFEQSAADGTPIRAIVGEHPVEFADEFLRNYPEGSWIGKERARLTDAIETITREGETP